MDPAEKKAHHLKIERQLIPRLKFMGVILLFFGLCSLIYGFFVHPLPFDEETPEQIAETNEESLGFGIIAVEDAGMEPFLTAEDTLNFFFVAIIFCSVGLSCIFISWKKRHIHQHIHLL